VRTNKQQQAVVQADESLTSEENKVEQKPEDETEVLVEEEEEVKDSWDVDSSSEEEVEEVSAPAVTTTAGTTYSKSKSESEDTENSSEEDESEDSDDSENEEGKKTDALSRREKALYRIQVGPLNRRDIFVKEQNSFGIFVMFPFNRKGEMRLKRTKILKFYVLLSFVYWVMWTREKRKFLTNFVEPTFKMVRLVELHSRLVLPMSQLKPFVSSPKWLLVFKI
jgi:hypothetical protein